MYIMMYRLLATSKLYNYLNQQNNNYRTLNQIHRNGNGVI